MTYINFQKTRLLYRKEASHIREIFYPRTRILNVIQLLCIKVTPSILDQ